MPPVCTQAVIVFHPNFAVGLDMVRHGQWYRTRGFSVLLVTMGGYAGSEGDTTELTTYLDAHAAVQHVHVQHGVSLERILCHGCSIGGALATAAAYMHPGVHCTVDQTFVNAREVTRTPISACSSLVPHSLDPILADGRCPHCHSAFGRWQRT